MDHIVTQNGPRRFPSSTSASSHHTIRPRPAPDSATSSADEGGLGDAEDCDANGPVRRVSAATVGPHRTRSGNSCPFHARNDSSDSSRSNHHPLSSLVSHRSNSSTSFSSAFEDETASDEVELATQRSGDMQDHAHLTRAHDNRHAQGSSSTRRLSSPQPEVFHIEDVAACDGETRYPHPGHLIVVIGVGYVGEHLVNVFSRKFNVIGYDISPQRAEQLSRKFHHNDRVRITADTAILRDGTHFLISVPTLLGADKTVDSTFLQSALVTVALHARMGSTVVIESSVAVGMTRMFLGPIAKEKGFFAGMSPERVDPGRTDPPAHSIPKVVSGLDDIVPGSLDAICKVYREVFDRVVPTSRPEVAEMMKLYENCQRMVCIAFANEMADACEAHGIDPFEVCGAASTKPFGYISMMPSLGVGGHCIPVNPHYLLANNEFPLLQAATEKMNARPAEIAQRSVQKLYKRLSASLEDDSDEDAHSDIMTPSECGSLEDDPNWTWRFGDSAADDVEDAPRRVRGKIVGKCYDEHGNVIVHSTSTPQSLPPSTLPGVLVVGIGFKAGQAHLVNSPGIELAKSLAATDKVSVSWCDPLVTQLAFSQVPRFDEARWNRAVLEREFKLIIVAFRQHGLDFDVLKDLDGVEVEMWCP